MTSDDGTQVERVGHIPCPECEHGHLEVSDAVYADCVNCDAAVLRTEVGI